MSDDPHTPRPDHHSDPDPQETAEWRDAFAAVLAGGGPARARFLLDQLAQLARQPSVGWEPPRGTPYANSIPVEQQPAFPGDLAIEERLASIMRWNALAMVARANEAHGELGGHIASYARAMLLPRETTECAATGSLPARLQALCGVPMHGLRPSALAPCG